MATSVIHDVDYRTTSAMGTRIMANRITATATAGGNLLLSHNASMRTNMR